MASTSTPVLLSKTTCSEVLPKTPIPPPAVQPQLAKFIVGMNPALLLPIVINPFAGMIVPEGKVTVKSPSVIT